MSLNIFNRPYENPKFVRLTRYETIGYVYILPIILTLGLLKNYVLTHAFKRVRIRSNLGRLLKILLTSDIIIWCLLVFYPLIHSIGIFSNAHYAGTRLWNSFILYFVQPALNTFFILNIHIVTMMAANQYLMYAFPRVHQIWKRKKYILKYVLIIDLFIVASMEYTMVKWLEVTRYRQSSYLGSPKDIYYHDVVSNPSDNYISYEVTNNLILVIAPLIFLLFLSFSNLRYYVQLKWHENVTNGKKVSPKMSPKKERQQILDHQDIATSSATIPLESVPGGLTVAFAGNQEGDVQQLPSSSQHQTPRFRELTERSVMRSKSDAKGVAEEKLLSILIIVLSFQYLLCNIPVAIIQILYPVYECYPGVCTFRFYVFIAALLQLLNPNIDFYIFYALKSLRKAVGTLWTSTRRKKGPGGAVKAVDKGPFYDSSSTLDELDDKQPTSKHPLTKINDERKLKIIDEIDNNNNDNNIKLNSAEEVPMA